MAAIFCALLLLSRSDGWKWKWQIWVKRRPNRKVSSLPPPPPPLNKMKYNFHVITRSNIWQTCLVEVFASNHQMLHIFISPLLNRNSTQTIPCHPNFVFGLRKPSLVSPPTIKISTNAMEKEKEKKKEKKAERGRRRKWETHGKVGTPNLGTARILSSPISSSFC